MNATFSLKSLREALQVPNDMCFTWEGECLNAFPRVITVNPGPIPGAPMDDDTPLESIDNDPDKPNQLVVTYIIITIIIRVRIIACVASVCRH